MNTTRFDHTACSHGNTPRGRKWCRETRRKEIMRAQAAFRTAWDVNETHEIREYNAIVELFAARWNMTREEAYDLIENGPVVY